MKKRLLPVSALLATALVVTACSSGGGTTAGDSDAGDRITIGVAVNDTNAFLTSGKEGMEAYAAANNIELLYKSAEGDTATQASQIEDFIRAGVDGITLTAVTQDSLHSQVDAAVAADIPVVVANFGIDHPGIAGTVLPDDAAAGEEILSTLAEELGGKGKIVVIQGNIGSSAQIGRDKGIHAAIEKNYPDIEILASDTGDWNRDLAANKMANWITAFGDDIDGVVSHNDDMALGALQAVREKGLDIPIVGIDGIEDGLRAVQNGQFLATMLQHGAVEMSAGLALTASIIRGTATEKNLVYLMPRVDSTNIDDFLVNIVDDRAGFLKQLPAIIDRNIKSGNISDESRVS